MSAIRVVTRMQDQDDGPGVLGAPEDGTLLRWTSALGKFVASALKTDSVGNIQIANAAPSVSLQETDGAYTLFAGLDNGIARVRRSSGTDTSLLSIDLAKETLGLRTAPTDAALDVRASTSAALGDELITVTADRDFSSVTGHWTGDAKWSIHDGAAYHTAGSGSFTLSTPLFAAGVYRVAYTTNTTTQGYLTARIGGTSSRQSGLQYVGSSTCVMIVVYDGTGDGLLKFYADATWVGFFDNVSVKLITPSTSAIRIRPSSGGNYFEMRHAGDGALFIGRATGEYQSGSNASVGILGLKYLLTGDYNVAIGSGALDMCTTGTANVAIGRNALALLVTGQQNLALGAWSMEFTGPQAAGNVGLGAYTLPVVRGSGNLGLGLSAGYNITTGDRNTCLGSDSGSSITTGSTNIAIGYGAQVPTATASNQLSIRGLILGTGADGYGGAIASGCVGIGILAPVSRLHVVSNTAAKIALIAQGAASQSAALMEWRNSAAAVLSSVDASGRHLVPLGALATCGLGFQGDPNTGLYSASADTVSLVAGGVDRIKANATGLGFFAATPIAKPTVSGSRGGNAALASLLTGLAALGLVVDGTTA